MKVVSILLMSCLLSVNSFAQNGKSYANLLFENYEYKAATEYFAQSSSELSVEELEKFAYCYYTNGNSYEGIPIIDSLIVLDDKKPHYWKWKAYLEKYNSQYDESIESYKRYSQLEGVDSISRFVENVDFIRTHNVDTAVLITNKTNNSSANFYDFIDGQKITFFEVGVDDTKKRMNLNSSENLISGFKLMRPYLQKKNNIFEEVKLFDNYPNFSISSLCLDKKKGVIFFSASDLTSSDERLRSPQIYFARFTDINSPLTDANLISFCDNDQLETSTHPTINKEGNLMVFAKIKNGEQKSNLWGTSLVNDVWSEPRLLSVSNKGDQMFPYFQGDSLLIYSSNGSVGYGGLDLYSIRSEDIWKEGVVPIHFDQPFNSQFDDFKLMHLTDSSGYFVSNRFGGKGDDDVWEFSIIQPLKEVPVKEDPVKEEFDNWLDQWEVSKIYFDFDKDVAPIPQEIIDGLNNYCEKQNMRVRLTGYTDSYGEESYNYELGMRRAKYVHDYIKDAVKCTVFDVESKGESGVLGNDSKNMTIKESKVFRFVEIEIIKN